MTDTQHDEYQSIPVADARAAVLASGEREALAGPFYLASPGGEPTPYFIPTDEAPHPVAGYVTIKRKGHEARDVWIPWGEYADELKLNDPSWLEKRGAKPMAIFGAEIERHAYRAEFADILAPLLRPSAPPVTPPQVREDPAPPPRDWHAEIAAAPTGADVDKLFAEARAARALTDADLVQAFGRRKREIAATPASPAPRDAPSPAVVASRVKPLAATPPKRPQGQRRRKRAPEAPR